MKISLDLGLMMTFQKDFGGWKFDLAFWSHGLQSNPWLSAVESAVIGTGGGVPLGLLQNCFDYRIDQFVFKSPDLLWSNGWIGLNGDCLVQNQMNQ